MLALFVYDSTLECTLLEHFMRRCKRHTNNSGHELGGVWAELEVSSFGRFVWKGF